MSEPFTMRRGALAWVASSIGHGSADADGGGNAAERAPRRLRRIAATGASQAVARGLSAAVTLVTVPVAISALGASQFGVWITISTVLSLGGVFDFGIGNGLIREAATADARGDLVGLRAAVSNAFVGLLAIAGLLLLAGSALSWTVRPEWLGFARDVDRSDLRWSLLAVTVSVALLVPSLAASRVQQGLQEGYRSAVWLALGAVTQLLGVLACWHADLSLPWFVIAFAGGPAVGAIANAFTVFFGRRLELRPDLRLVRWHMIRGLGRVGALFFFLGLVGAAAYECDAIVIGRRLGASAVAEYSVAYRLFTVVPLGVGVFVAALWPAYGEATARGDIEWVRTAYRRSIGICLALNGIAAIALLRFADPIVEFWVGHAVSPSRGLVLALAAFAVVNSWSGPMAMVLNGTGVVGFQVKCALCMVSSNVALSWILVGHIGAAGPVFATVIAQVVCILVPSGMYLRRHLVRTEAVG